MRSLWSLSPTKMTESKEYAEARRLCQLTSSLLNSSIECVDDQVAELRRQTGSNDTSPEDAKQCNLYADDAEFWLRGRDLHHYLSAKPKTI